MDSGENAAARRGIALAALIWRRIGGGARFVRQSLRRLAALLLGLCLRLSLGLGLGLRL